MSPCYSTIRTKLTNRDDLIEALKQTGHATATGTDYINAVKDNWTTIFSRQKEGEAYSVAGSLANLSSISRKYAEIGVRKFATQRGFSVVSNDGRTMVLISRRG